MVNRLFQKSSSAGGPHPNRVRVLAWCLLVVVVAMSSAAVFYAYRGESAANDAKLAAEAARTTTRQVKKVGEAQACRSEFLADLTDAQTEVSNLTDLLDSVRLDIEINGLVLQDDGAVRAGVKTATLIREARDTAVVDRSHANDRYQELIDAQRQDPAEFLRLCVQGPPS